jgi:hypothetical protein
MEFKFLVFSFDILPLKSMFFSIVSITMLNIKLENLDYGRRGPPS